MTNPIPQVRAPRDNTLTPAKTLLIKLAQLALLYQQALEQGGQSFPLDPEVQAWLESMRQKGLL